MASFSPQLISKFSVVLKDGNKELLVCFYDDYRAKYNGYVVQHAIYKKQEDHPSITTKEFDDLNSALKYFDKIKEQLSKLDEIDKFKSDKLFFWLKDFPWLTKEAIKNKLENTSNHDIEVNGTKYTFVLNQGRTNDDKLMIIDDKYILDSDTMMSLYQAIGEEIRNVIDAGKAKKSFTTKLLVTLFKKVGLSQIRLKKCVKDFINVNHCETDIAHKVINKLVRDSLTNEEFDNFVVKHYNISRSISMITNKHNIDYLEKLKNGKFQQN